MHDPTEPLDRQGAGGVAANGEKGWTGGVAASGEKGRTRGVAKNVTGYKGQRL